MGIKHSIKKKIMLAALKRKNREQPFDLVKYENHTLANDATRFDINSYYFSAHNLGGESLLFRQALRGEGFHEMWFVYHTKDGTYANKISSYTNGNPSGLSLSLVEAGREWKFKFRGKLVKMRIDETRLASFSDQEVDVEAEGTFRANSAMFDFAYHLDRELLADALAKEKWNRRFKNDSKLNQQTHIEQQGVIEATIKIDGRDHSFKANAMRDHSFGRRDWDYMDRHIWLMALIREGEALNLNRVSYPHMSQLVTGYYEKDNRVQQISKKTNMARIPNNGFVPDKFSYHVELQNGLIFDVKAEVEVIIPFVFNEGKYVLFEGIGSFDINKRKARGIIEFGFNEDETRWNKGE